MSLKQFSSSRTLRSLSKTNKVIGLTITVLVLVVGYVIVTSFAAKNFATTEPENSLKTGPVTSVADASASNGNALKFGSGFIAPGPDPDESRCPPWPEFPDGNCTGVPPGTQLTPSGSLNVTTDGTVIEGLDISGTVRVAANNVTIKNTRVRGGLNKAVFEAASGTNIRVIDTEISMNGTLQSVTNYVPIIVRSDASVEFLRINAFGGGDIMKLSSNVTLRDSYLHDPFHPEGAHADLMQYRYSPGNIFSNINIIHNRLMAYSPATNDISNAVFIRASNEITKNFLFEYNYVDGGNKTIYCPQDVNNENVIFRNNKFGRNYRFGPTAGCGDASVQWDYDTNVYADTNQPVIAP